MSDPADEAGSRRDARIDFATLVLSLSASAMAHLGVSEASDSSEPPAKNLPLARQTIDILELLQRKTRGNLDEAEQRLLDSVVHDLRLRYIEAESR
jgi:hypothetical protein